MIIHSSQLHTRSWENEEEGVGWGGGCREGWGRGRETMLKTTNDLYPQKQTNKNFFFLYKTETKQKTNNNNNNTRTHKLASTPPPHPQTHAEQLHLPSLCNRTRKLPLLHSWEEPRRPMKCTQIYSCAQNGSRSFFFLFFCSKDQYTDNRESSPRHFHGKCYKMAWTRRM